MTRNKHWVEEIFQECGAIQRGHFELTSGRHSDIYLEKALIYPDTELVSGLCCQIVFDHHRQFSGEKIEAVVGPAVGGVVLSQWVAYHFSNLYYHKKVLSVFTEKDKQGRQVLRRGFQKLVAGKNVLIVDDVLLTGGSIKQVVEVVEAAGGKVLHIEVICNRGEMVSPFLSALWHIKLEDWPKEECPLCKAGIPITNKEGKSTPLLNCV